MCAIMVHINWDIILNCYLHFCTHLYLVYIQTQQQPVPSPAPPPTPLFPASPATSIGSPAQQPSMTPEENEAYVRKLSEYQKYIPLLQKWIQRLGKDEKKGDQYGKVKSLLSLLQNDQRRYVCVCVHASVRVRASVLMCEPSLSVSLQSESHSLL